MAPRIFFKIFIYFFFKNKTDETHARTFLPLNIAAVGSVTGVQRNTPVLGAVKIPEVGSSQFLFDFLSS
jgi:hypothetical protein